MVEGTQFASNCVFQFFTTKDNYGYKFTCGILLCRRGEVSPIARDQLTAHATLA